MWISARWLLLFLIVLSILGLAGCGSGAKPINVAGNWAGTISDSDITPSQLGTASLTLSEDGHGNLIASFNLTAFQCTTQNDSLTGKLTGTQLSLSAQGTSQITPTSLLLTADAAVDHLDGTFDFSDPGLGCGAGGTISLTKQ